MYSLPPTPDSTPSTSSLPLLSLTNYILVLSNNSVEILNVLEVR